MKKFLLYITTLLLILTNSACSDYLDKEYDASLSEEKVFGNESLTRQFLSNIYTNLPDGLAPFNDNQFTGASRDCMTDNATSYWGLHYYNKINLDAYTATDHPLLGFWNTDFSGIRKCNVFLKNAKASVVGNASLSGDDNHLYDRYCAEAKLLRAIFHFDLVCWFGDAPIVGEDESGTPIVFDMDNQEQMNISRTSAPEVLEWIAQQCDEVKDLLPFRYSNEDINWGRINGATAYALKSRALLYRASALNNPTNDKTYWTNAAQAAKDFITKNAQQSRPYELYADYQKCFYDNPTYNNEIILARSVWNTNTIDLQLLPPGFTGSVSGAGRTNPTQNFVDCFEMTNGKRIDEANSGYKETDPYANRDPRLEATIFHHGSIWGRADQGEQRAVDVHFNSATDKGADYRESMGGTYTGYYQKKFVNPNLILKDAKTFPHAWIIFRYAEILLNAAEAINESEGPSQAYQYVNQVRTRAGMPGFSDMNQETFRTRIRNERRVELCFEDHRFFDVRRWRLYDGVTSDNELSKPRYEQLLNMYGIEVTISGSSPQYTLTGAPGTIGNDMDLRVFNNPKNYYFPIPSSEVKRAPNLKQNPGWETTGSDTN
ncbi:RagB/SusD family nutrient uptake outer membrane protein [uncultured Bacteroides sp.]|uniref:RagB/SusD family nutrient uptake outer membrane protein n=1 Tax=uncultured Bacteroides sp. TaxID=162156 RepID=UPI002AA875B7|nr:RagB/SusD family nutrient uptake outer membrane protein [uncultured Bacteroides sp.]